METYKGLYIPTHKVVDRASKLKAENSLVGWQEAEFTAEEWIQKLDLGQTIQPSIFVTKADGTFSHAMTEQITDKETDTTEIRPLWQSSNFMCCDGDNLKNIEFDEETGKDKNPNGLEPWTEAGLLSQKMPRLLVKAYAVGESVSSMIKEPLHRRFRIVFLFDKPFTNDEHYKYVFSQLAKEFPIISNTPRAPSQPVFGNGRKDFNFHICGNILKLDNYPMPKPKETRQAPKSNGNGPDETLEQFLRRHNIAFTLGKQSGKFYVECPYKNGHTGGKQGKTDSYVFDDGSGWAYYCSHAHCGDKRTWQAFKDGMGIKNGNGKSNGNNKGYSYQPPAVSQPPPTEDQIERSDIDEKMVKFPEEMFYGIFETYRKSIDGRTPIPDAFAFASIKHLLSATLGRRIHIESQIPIFPNIFTGLIGESGDAHKGVSLTLARQLMEQADPNVIFLTKTDTEEGLIDLFRTPELRTGTNDDGEENDYYINGISHLYPHERLEQIVGNIDSHESVRIMGCFEELSSVMARSKKATFSGMMERIMELYDMKPEIFVGTKHNKTLAEFPTFTMIGGSAFELIEQSLAQHFITAGFTNRIEWYIGEEKDPILLYKRADAGLWTECVEEIKKIRDSYVVGQSFELTSKAYQLADKWNKEFTEKRKEIDNILISGSIKRMKMFTLKNALIFAALEHRADFKINENDILKALQLCQYNCTVAEKLFGSFSNTEHQRVCKRIVEILKKAPMMSAKSIQNQMRWADIKDIDMAIDLMVKMQILGINTPKRTAQFYVKKDEIE